MKALWLCTANFNEHPLCKDVFLDWKEDKMVCKNHGDEKTCDSQVLWLPQEGLIGVWSERRSIKRGGK